MSDSTPVQELNLTAHRAAASVWERRGWDGKRQPGVTRWLVGGGGALAILGLRRGVRGSFFAALGGTLAWWALTGQGALSIARRWLMQVLGRAPWHHHEDLVHEASAESFPASDAPAWTPTCRPSLRRRCPACAPPP